MFDDDKGRTYILGYNEHSDCPAIRLDTVQIEQVSGITANKASLPCGGPLVVSIHTLETGYQGHKHYIT
jgi:hypothetical protein